MKGRKRSSQRKASPWVALRWFRPERCGIAFASGNAKEGAFWKIKGVRAKYHAIIMPLAMLDKLQSKEIKSFYRHRHLRSEK